MYLIQALCLQPNVMAVLEKDGWKLAVQILTIGKLSAHIDTDMLQLSKNLVFFVDYKFRSGYNKDNLFCAEPDGQNL